MKNKYQIEPLGIQSSQDSNHQCSKCRKNISVGKTIYLVSQVGKEKKELRGECCVKSE